MSSLMQPNLVMRFSSLMSCGEVNTDMNLNVLDSFGFGDDFDGEDKFLAFRPKRKKYKLYDGPRKVAREYSRSCIL